tara:strand:- start:139 stop:1290 length:1152 start_codon:yes stop_codon:yes gene_type:complete
MKFKLVIVIILLLELFIGGSGQVFLMFDTPLRQILYVLILLTFGLDILIKPKYLKKSNFNWIVIAIIIWAVISACIGILKEHDVTIVTKDLQPVLYFLLFFPLKYYFNKYKLSYSFLYKFLLISSFVISISVLYLFFVLHILFNGDTFLFYDVLLDYFGREIIWLRRGGYIFYPGLFYVFISIILIIDKSFSQGKLKIYEKIIYILGLVSLILSMTKGYVIVLIIGHYLIFNRYIKSSSQALRSISLTIIIISVFLLNINFEETRMTRFSADTGIDLRFQTLNESIDKFSENIILGNGFGTELNTKKFHQENSFLDILVEQGLIGFFLYIILFVIVYKFRNRNYALSISFFMSYILSITNPYINNPIGIGLIILVLIFLEKDN